MIPASLQTCGGVFPFAISISICRSNVTICAALYLFAWEYFCKRLSLLFGSTWVVNAVVISTFLMMALAANMIVAHATISRRVSYAWLVIVIVGSSIIPYDRFTSSPTAAVVAGLLIASPVFFSGLIFSSSFRDVTSPAGTLGVNMLGAVLGGLLENLTMIGGTTLVSILALLIYVGSAITLNKVEERVLRSSAATL